MFMLIKQMFNDKFFFSYLKKKDKKKEHINLHKLILMIRSVR